MTTNAHSEFITFIKSLSEEQLDEMMHFSKQFGYTDGFCPKKSMLSDEALADFLRAPLTGQLIEVPGIGPTTVKVLAKGSEPIVNTFQMIGKFMLLKSNDQETGDLIESSHHCDKFWRWLKLKGVTSHRDTIVMAIAEKTNTMMPGIYNPID